LILIWTFLWLFGTPEVMPRPIIVLDEETTANDLPALIYPYDAVMLEERIFVAGGDHRIHVFSKSEWLRSFGRKGQGPGEFAHPPVRISLKQGTLVATEMYFHRALVLSLEGEVLTETKPEKPGNLALHISGESRELERSSYVTARDSGLMLRDPVDDCFFGTAAGPSQEDHHLSSFFLETDAKSRIVFVRRNGLVQIYSEGCDLVRQWPIPVRHLAREVIEDKWANLVRKEYYAEKYPGTRFRTAYRYGIPIVDVVVDIRDRLFVIAQDETQMTEDRKPGICELIVLNLETGKTVAYPLDWAPSRIRISEDKLILISSEDALIKVWALEAFE